MKKTFLHIFTAVTLLTLFSCPNVPESKPTDKSQSKTSCEILYMLYLSGDQNINSAVREALVTAENGLFNLQQAKSNLNIKIIALWDGSAKPEYQVEGTCVYPDTKLYELGPKSGSFFDVMKANFDIEQDEKNGKITAEEKLSQQIQLFTPYYSIGSETKDLTATADFIPKLADGSTEADLSDYHTLESFIKYCYDHYEYKTSILHLFGHGSGVYSDSQQPKKDNLSSSRSYCPDDTSIYASNSIGTHEMGDVLEASFKKSGKKIDCVIFENCLSAGFEELYEIRNYAKYACASANILLGPSIDFGKFIPKIVTGCDGKYIGSMYYETQKEWINCIYKYGNMVIYSCDSTADKYSSDAQKSNTFGIFDLSYCDEVFTAFEDVSQELVYGGSCLSSLNRSTTGSHKLNYEDVSVDKYPTIATYLIDKNYAYLSKRNDSGLVGDKCTSLFYKGTYHYLYDIGYLMDMLIQTDFPNNKIVKQIDLSSSIPVYYFYDEADINAFKNKCKKVNQALNKMIIKSFRRDSTGQEFLTDLYSQLPGYTEFGNHYGVTICGSNSNFGTDKDFARTDYRYFYWSAFGAKSSWLSLVSQLFTN